MTLKQAVAKLCIEGTDTPYTGTAWLCSRQHALTAAHCVGDRHSRELLPGRLTLRFPWGEAAASVVRHDFDLDAALLALASAAPPEAEPIPAGTLPARDPWPQGADALGWHAYGYPSAHPSGLTLTGLISSPDGNVEGSPAVELFCNMGGLGSLEGASGAPACFGAYAFGLIRYGPPRLKQMVIHAAPLKEIAGRFPEVAALLEAGRTSAGTAERSNAFRQVKIDTLARRLALLIEQYTAASEQYDVALDPTTRVRLKRLIEGLEEEIKGVEAEIDGLR